MKLLFLIVLLYSYQVSIDGLKILGILPFPSKSHWLVGHEIIKTLVEAGHEATVLTIYPSKTPMKNYEEIDISEIAKKFEEGKKDLQ